MTLTLSIVEEKTLVRIIKEEYKDIDFDNLPEREKRRIIDNATRLILNTVN